MRILKSFLVSLTVMALVSPAAQAADADTAYIVTYFETAPAAAGKAVGLLRDLGKPSRKEAGNLRFETLQRVGQRDQFVILEAWKDKEAQAGHAAAAHTTKFRDALGSLLRGPYDERPHIALEVGDMGAAPAGGAKAGAIYAVTHVDIIPPQKDNGVALVKQSALDGRRDKGNVRYEALTQASRPNHMTVVEIWSGRKALEAHSAAAHKKELREKLMPMSGSLYDERFYKAVN